MHFKIKIPSLFMTVKIYVGEEEKAAFKKEFEITDVDDAEGLQYGKNIWVSGNNLEFLIHELHHLVYFITKDKGIDDAETEAYLMQYLYIECIKKMTKVYDSFKLYTD